MPKISNKHVYRVSVDRERQSYYRTDNLYYDPASLTELTGQGPWAGRYQKASAADKLLIFLPQTRFPPSTPLFHLIFCTC